MSVTGAESEVGRALASCTKPSALSPAFRDGVGVQGHPQLHEELEVILDYLTLSKEKRKREITWDLKGLLQHPGFVFQLTPNTGLLAEEQSLESLFDLEAG